MFSCDYCEIFKVTNFEEQLLLFIQTSCWNIRIVCHKKTCFQTGFEFVKKKVIYRKVFHLCKEKSGVVKELLSKIKKHNQWLQLDSNPEPLSS